MPTRRSVWTTLTALVLIGTPVWAARASSATAVGAPEPRYHLQSPFWVNLHQTLLRASQSTEVSNPGVDDGERGTWDRCVAAYRARFGEHSPVFDPELIAVNDALSRAASDAAPPESIGPVREVLAQAADVYRRRQWAQDLAADRFWIAVVGAMLDQAGEELVRAHEAVYGARYPAHVTIDVAPYGGEFGAYTTTRGGFVHTTVSTRDPAYQGYWGLEMMLHESSHAVVGDADGAIGPEITAAARTLDRRAPPALWHAVLFYTSGELTRRALAARGIDYHPFILEMYKRTYHGFQEPLETYWQAYLDGKLAREQAIRQLVEATTRPGSLEH